MKKWPKKFKKDEHKFKRLSKEKQAPKRLNCSDIEYLLAQWDLTAWKRQKRKKLFQWKRRKYMICRSCWEERLKTRFSRRGKICNICTYIPKHALRTPWVEKQIWKHIEHR